MKRRTVNAMISMSMIATMCLGCGTTIMADEAADPFGKYEDTIDLHFARQSDDIIETMLTKLDGQTLEDNFWLDTYRDELGINVVYDWIVKGNDEYTQKVNVTIANGDIPDAMVVSSTQMKQMQEADLLADLTDLYEEYAADFTKETMTQEGDTPFLSTTIDGKLYALPITSGSCDSVDVMWIRQDWLDKLGLKVPETTDELLDVIDKFTHDDPDGNGEDDTYGIGVTGSPNVFVGNYGSLRGFFDAFDAHADIWYEKDGELQYGAIQPECKDALTALNQLYKDGEINPEFGAMDSGKAGEAAASGKCGLTFGPQWLSQTELMTCYKADNNANWCAYPIPSKEGETSKASAYLGSGGCLVVSKECEHPEAVIKMVNLFMEKCWGKTGDNEKYYAPQEVEGIWKLSPTMPQMPLKNIESYRSIVEAEKNNTTDQLTGEAKSIWDKLDAFHKDPAANQDLYGWERGYGDGWCAFAAIDDTQKNDRILVDGFVGAPTETMTEKMSTLKKMRDEVYVKIILGESDISEFDKFVEDFNNLGGSDITKEVAEWKASLN